MIERNGSIWSVREKLTGIVLWTLLDITSYNRLLTIAQGKFMFI